jgi:hypothetical protein
MLPAAIDLARSLYPLTSVPDPVLTAWGVWAQRLAGAGFGPDRVQAIAHLLGHAGEMWARATSGGTSTGGGGGVAGVVASSSTSSLSVSYGAWSGAGSWVPATAGDAALAQTEGGRAYLALRDAVLDISAPWVA